MENKNFTVNQTGTEKRLDKYLAEKNKELSRSYIQKLIAKGNVLVNGRKVKGSYLLSTGDKIELMIPEAEEPDLQPLDIELDIIFEDKDIIVINKPAGIIIHPVPDNDEHTLVNALLAHVDNLSGIGGVKRPGIVHRLDKNTSGVLVAAKNDKSHRDLIHQFKKRQVKKIYYAVICGRLPYKSGKIDAPIGRDVSNRTRMAVTDKNSKRAITFFSVRKYFADFTFVEVELKTGRTHQIRVHFAHIGYPVAGDKKYGTGTDIPGIKRQLLHAHKLGLKHPVSGKWCEFTAEVPADFKKFLDFNNAI